MKYRADIDGLRALAILPVLLFHVGIGAFSGGYVGVDIFFVISGFIIARTLLDDLEAGRFSILTFYERRIRRIFPALIFVMMLTWVVAYAMLLPSDFIDYSKSLLSSAGFISNLYFWKYSGYFENSALLRPLLHTWSLSVEEQFYIFMPVAMWLIYRYWHKRWELFLVPACLLSLALSTYALQVGPTANFFLLPTRAWELLLGAMLAVIPIGAIRARWINELLGLAAVGLIAVAVFAFTEATPFPGPYALLPCVGAALIIYLGGHGQTWVSRLLSCRPLVGIGLISYSLYLVHWPIAVFMRHYTLRTPTSAEIVLMLMLSFVLAAFSWRFIEQPFRKPKVRAPRRRVLVAGVIAMVGMALLAAVGITSHGFPKRFPDFVEAKAEKSEHWRNGKCFFAEGEDFSGWSAANCTLTRGHGDAGTTLLWGDSYAAHYVPGIVALNKNISQRVLQYTFAGCPPVLSYYSYARPKCQAFNQKALEIITAEKVKTVILSARWVDLQRRGLSEIRSTLDALAAMGVRVYVIGQSPMFATSVQTIALRKGDNINAWESSIAPSLNAQLQLLSAGAEFIDPADYLCADGLCEYRVNDAFVYNDSGHLSLIGSQKAVEAYLPVFGR